MRLYSGIVTAMCVAGLLNSAETHAKTPKLKFEKQTVSLQTPTVGDITRLEGDSGETRLLIQSGRTFNYIHELGKGPLADKVQTLQIPGNVLFYDKGKLAGTAGQVLFYFTGDEVQAIDLATQTVKNRVAVESFYRGQQSEKVQQSSFIVDANDDGLSDILTHDFTQANLYLQNAQGEFVHQKLTLAPDSRVNDDGVRFSAHKVVVGDANGDGSTDLMFQVENQLQVFLADKGQSFATEPVQVALNGGILTRAERSELIAQGKKPKSRIDVEQLIDLNGDGLMDLVTKEETREGMMSSTSQYPVRFGQLKQGMLFYAETPDTVMTQEGQGTLQFEDVDNDGLQDYYTISVEIGVGSVMSLMSGSIDADLQFYRMNKSQEYAGKPAYDGELTFSIESDDNGGSGRPLLAVEDFDGDGIKDLIKQTDDDEFRIYNGSTGKRLFAKRGAKYGIDLPTQGRVEVGDFNGDGKADLLFVFGGKKGNGKATLWLSPA